MKISISDIVTYILATLLFLFFSGFVLLFLAMSYENLFPEPTEVSCRNGKLFEVSHDHNIIIYTPTYEDCEVTQ